MHVSLIVPAPCDAVSGGYAYDRRIVAGLREAGHTVQVVELSGSHPLADATAVNTWVPRGLSGSRIVTGTS